MTGVVGRDGWHDTNEQRPRTFAQFIIMTQNHYKGLSCDLALPSHIRRNRLYADRTSGEEFHFVLSLTLLAGWLRHPFIPLLVSLYGESALRYTKLQKMPAK